MVERPGRCPAQYSAQRDRGAIGAAAAARLLQPLILHPAPKIVPPHLCYNIITIMEARTRNGGGGGGRTGAPNLSGISPVLT